MSKASATALLERPATPEAPDPGRKSYNQPCLIAQTLSVLGDRWTLLILRDLMSGLNRYSDILENCAGMSPNVLADRLVRLEGDGIIEKDASGEGRGAGSYRLTAKGVDLLPVMLAIIDWSAKHDPKTAADRGFVRRLRRDRDGLQADLRSALLSARHAAPTDAAATASLLQTRRTKEIPG